MLVDTNVSFGRWPFRTAPGYSARELESVLLAEGIGRAYVSSMAALFVDDPAEANTELFSTFSGGGSTPLITVPVLNPRLRNWELLFDEYSVRRLIPAVKLHSNYHGYSLDTAPVGSLARRLSALGKPLLLPLRMEDERFQNPRMQVPSIQVEDVIKLARSYKDLNILCLNAYRKETLDCAEYPNLFFDIAFVDWFKPVDDLLHRLGPGRILFGSHTPLFVTRAAVMKVDAADAPAGIKRQIAGGNAGRLFGAIHP